MTLTWISKLDLQVTHLPSSCRLSCSDKNVGTKRLTLPSEYDTRHSMIYLTHMNTLDDDERCMRMTLTLIVLNVRNYDAHNVHKSFHLVSVECLNKVNT